MASRLHVARHVLSGDIRGLPLPEVARTAQRLIAAATIAANAVGAAIVMLLLFLVLPLPDEAIGQDPAGPLLSAGYTVAAIIYGTRRGLNLARPVISMFAEEARPTELERAAILGLPMALLGLQARLWGGAALVFGALSLQVSALFAFEVFTTVALGGLATGAIAYLQTQRLLRGGVDVVLADAPPRRREVAGVGARALLAWALGTSVPVTGALLVACFALVSDVSARELSRATIVLCAVALSVGLFAMIVFARSISDPLRRLRDAFADVEDGDLDVSVPVYDATEVGYAAAGFNRMVDGLRERERLRDLFGRQVGEDVARRALEEGVTLGGEEREAAALFVDIIGSTGFAADRPPGEVVDALNRFFGIVVEVTQAHGGLVNKFAGDAALCVFGAPLAREDPAGSALAAGREMRRRLHGGLDAAIGVSAGTVVAGNVGTADRYEYTVVGDPVNEASRLTELAKERDGRLLASEAAVRRASEEEARRWRLVEEVTLRGRAQPTRLAEPA